MPKVRPLNRAIPCYRYVCGDFLQPKGHPNAGAELYISRNVIDLNDLGSMLASGDEGDL